MTSAEKTILVRMLAGRHVGESRAMSRLIRHGFASSTSFRIKSAFGSHIRRTRYHLTEKGTSKAVEIMRSMPPVRSNRRRHSVRHGRVPTQMIVDRYGKDDLPK